MNFFHHKDLGNHLLQLCPKVVKHPVYIYIYIYLFIYLFIWDIPLCLMSYKVNKLFIAAIKHNNIFSF